MLEHLLKTLQRWLRSNRYIRAGTPPSSRIPGMRGSVTLIGLGAGLAVSLVLYPRRADPTLPLSTFLWRGGLIIAGMLYLLFPLLDWTFGRLEGKGEALTSQPILPRLALALVCVGLLQLPTLWLAGWALGVADLIPPAPTSLAVLLGVAVLTLILALAFMLTELMIVHRHRGAGGSGLAEGDGPGEAGASPPFFIAGGTLQGSAPSYVERSSDDELFHALKQGHFCYVLTSRQMGKSSLMVRTAQRLRQEGVAVASVDLTAIGHNLTAEQWYYGLVTYLGQSLDLEDALEDFWTDHPQWSPLQRWDRAIEEVVLPRIPGSIVIFVDEIDIVRSLPFATDELFANIRAFYNRRTQQPALHRLTFCLLGVATPADLIRDARLTPFNIGRRIELMDFTAREAESLAAGLRAGSAEADPLLERILYWTGGHPYLTQRLCLEVARTANRNHPGYDGYGTVDEACRELFLLPRARERDDNLLFVRERLLSGEVERSEILDLYRQVLRRPHPDEERNPVVGALRLSGIVRAERGFLWVRNRIYRAVFDPGWVKAQLPDTERRRQRLAFLRGAGLVGTLATLLLSAALWANAELVYQKNLAEQARARAESERGRAEQEREGRERMLYTANMNLAQQAWRGNNTGRVTELLELNRRISTHKDLRGFEWFHFWRLLHRDRLTLTPLGTGISASTSADGRLLATFSKPSGAEIWRLPTGERLATFSQEGSRFGRDGALSPDGRLVAVCDQASHLSVVERAVGRPLWRSPQPIEQFRDVRFSPDGHLVAVGDFDGQIQLWESATGTALVALKEVGPLGNLAFAPAGTILASTGGSDHVTLWSVPSGRRLRSLEHNFGGLPKVEFSPRGDLIAAGGTEGSIKLWDTTTWREYATIPGDGTFVWGLVFSPDGKLLATGGNDNVIRLWNIPERRLWAKIRGHLRGTHAVAFTEDGRTLVSRSEDGIVKLWDAKQQEDAEVLAAHTKSVSTLAFSPDGRWLASGSDDQTVLLWDVATRRQIASFPGIKGGAYTLAFSPDGSLLACGMAPVRPTDTSPGQLLVWDVASRKVLLDRDGFARGIYAVAFEPGGKTLATAALDGKIEFWDVNSGRITAGLPGNGESIFSIAYSPDGRRLGVVIDSANVQVWDTVTLGRIDALNDCPYPTAVAFSPDGRYLAAGSASGMACIWDAHSLSLVTKFRAHAALVVWLTFTPDGRRLASAGRDFSPRLWDVDTWQELITFEGHTAQVDSGVFSPDGRILATGSGDHTIRLWQAATLEESEPAGSATPPNPSPAP